MAQIGEWGLFGPVLQAGNASSIAVPKPAEREKEQQMQGSLSSN